MDFMSDVLNNKNKTIWMVLKNVTMANYFASMLSHSCDKEYLVQYKDILNQVDMEKKKQQKGMNDLLASAMSGSG